jgi:hypothetical protein
MLLLLPLCGIAVAGVVAAAPRDLASTFDQGETLDYNLTWLRLTGGSMRLTIAPQGEHYRLTSIAKSSRSFARIFSVRDELQSLVNRTDFSTVRFEKHLNERGRHKDDVTTIDERRRIATRRRPGKDTEEVGVPKPIFDPLSLIYHLRTLDLTPGTVLRFNVFADGKLYTLEAAVTGRETVETPAGKFNTIVVEPRMLAGGIFRDESAKLTIWYSDDPQRIPVRISSEVKVGTISAVLKATSAGVGAIEP